MSVTGRLGSIWRTASRMPLVAAEGVHYIDDRGRRILDGLSGLWCSGAGHNRPEIAEAVARQLRTLDYAPAFQFGHPGAFTLANRIRDLTPDGLDYVFFTNSGSEAADTALKLARAYWQQRGQPNKCKHTMKLNQYRNSLTVSLNMFYYLMPH